MTSFAIPATPPHTDPMAHTYTASAIEIDENIVAAHVFAAETETAVKRFRMADGAVTPADVLLAINRETAVKARSMEMQFPSLSAPDWARQLQAQMNGQMNAMQTQMNGQMNGIQAQMNAMQTQMNVQMNGIQAQMATLLARSANTTAVSVILFLIRVKRPHILFFFCSQKSINRQRFSDVANASVEFRAIQVENAGDCQFSIGVFFFDEQFEQGPTVLDLLFNLCQQVHVQETEAILTRWITHLSAGLRVH